MFLLSLSMLSYLVMIILIALFGEFATADKSGIDEYLIILSTLVSLSVVAKIKKKVWR